MPRSRSRSRSTSRSRDRPEPTGNRLDRAPPRSRIFDQQPPPTSATFYEGGPVLPQTLANDLLHPTARPTNPRTNSWRELLLTSQDDKPPSDHEVSSRAPPHEHDREPSHLDDSTANTQVRRHNTVPVTESTSLLNDNGSDRTRRDRNRVGSPSSLPWYKRPSPIWLLPGTFLMAISMGLTFAPKLEIYTQLICRSMDPAKSKVSLPPPVISTRRDFLRYSPVIGKFEGSSGDQVGRPSYQLELVGHPGEGAGEGKGEVDEEQKRKHRDQEWAKQCHRSSAVQSSVARLALLLTLMMGILSSLTTGWWGSYSDRKGRKPILILAMFGTVAMDAVFLLTVNFHHLVSYNFLLLGPVLDGLLGGFSTAQATTNAYLSDCTSPGSRARIFSLLAGLMFAGFALGPILSSLLITYATRWFNVRDPTQIVLIPFYIALVSHLCYLGLLTVGLPESLSVERKESSQKRYENERASRKEKENEMDLRAKRGGTWKVYVRKGWTTLERVFGFLRPLGLLLPREEDHGSTSEEQTEGQEPRQEEAEELRTNIDWGKDLKEYQSPAEVWKNSEGGPPSLKKGRRDWTLTKIAIGYSSYMMIIAIISVKLQYANYTFDWSAKEDGLFLSYIGVLRVVALLVFLPLFIRILRKPAPDPIRPKPAEAEPDALQRWEKEKKWLKVVTDSHFDLRLARLSLLIDLVGFLFFSLISLSPHPTAVPFLLATFLQSLGSGASPTLQSLALAHSTPRDSGRLFASFSVVQSLSSQVIGPILFGTTFINTVGRGKWTGMVFWMAMTLCLISWISVSTLRLRQVWIDPQRNDHVDSTEYVDATEPTTRPGGVSKPVKTTGPR